ncbi:MAG: AraC family transcriptional regulator [Actinomycetota bacterium]|nr:AraC family transcriptional regulator [Actinomycetota bacterium]
MDPVPGEPRVIGRDPVGRQRHGDERDPPRARDTPTPPLSRLHKIDTSRLSGRVRPRLKPRGLPPALSPHPVWSTHDPSEARHEAAELLGPHRLVVDEPSAFAASYHAVRLRDVTLGFLDYSPAVRIEVEALPDPYLVLVASGSSLVQVGGAAAEATAVHAVLPPPGAAATITCGELTSHLVIRIEQQALLVHLGRVLGRQLDRPLDFDLAFDLTTPSATRWNFAIQMLHAELLESGSLLHRGVGAGQLEEFVMSSLLFAHRSTYSDALTRPGQGVEHRVTRLAKDYVDVHLSEPLTVAGIAAAAGVSARTLQSAFRSELDTTPMSYVRDRRLDRARADLADAAGDDAVNVTLIATRWGFGHLGRFAADYRARFGESPSRTLRG